MTVFGVEAVMNRSCWGGGHAEGKQRKHDFRCLESKKRASVNASSNCLLHFLLPFKNLFGCAGSQ